MSSTLNNELGTTDVLWNLNDLYASLNDEQLKDDLDFCQQEADLLKQDCEGRLAELEPAVFTRTVRRLERIQVNLDRIETFAFLHFITQVKDSESGAFLQQSKENASQVSRHLVFFELEWAKMDQANADRLIAGEDSAPYRHYLGNLRRYAQHLLSGPEETLLVELAPAGKESWLTLFEKLMGHLEFGANKRSEEEVLSDLYDSDREVRRKAALELTEGLQSQMHILTHIFNTLAADKMVTDRIRNHTSWVSSMNLSNEIKERTGSVAKRQTTY